MIGAAGIAAAAPSTTVVISQVYGGGGNSGAPFDQDFIELLNKSNQAVDLSGWSIQYASASATTGVFSSANTKALSGIIPAGGYYLIGCGFGADLTLPDLPTPDLALPTTSTLALSGTTGKVALANTTTPLGTISFSNSNPTLVDLVAYGAAAPFEGTAAAPALTNATAAARKSSGSLDTDDNAADFQALAPAPRNSASPVFGGDSTPPTLAAATPLSPANGATGVLLTTNLTVKLSEVITKGTGNVLLYLEAGAVDTLVQTFAPADGVVSGESITYDPTANLNPNATYYVVVQPTAIKDFAGNFFAGLAGPAWTFTTGNSDVTPPTATLFPLAGSNTFLPTANLAITYNEPVVLGSGAIVLKNPDNSIRETFTLPSAAVTVSGSVVTINPTQPLDYSTAYTVTVPSGTVTDLAGNSAAAIPAWTFTTRALSPVLISQYYEGTGDGLNRFIELKNTTNSPVSLAGYRLVAWSPTDGGNQAWKNGTATTTRITDFSAEAVEAAGLNITIPANGNYLVVLPGSLTPLDSVNNADLADAFPAVTAFSGTASIVLYNGADFAVDHIVDAVSITGTEGTDVSFYRANNLPGFDLTVGTSITAYPTTWVKKTIPEVNAATLADEFVLKGAVVGQTLTMSFSPSSFSEAAGEAASTVTITRSGSTLEDGFITLRSLDLSEVAVPFSVTIPAGSASATFTIDAVNDTVPDGSKVVQIEATGLHFYTSLGSVTVTDDGDPPVSIVINEVDSDSPGDDIAEFVELYNNSETEKSLDGLILVFLNGGPDGDPVYMTVDLTGYTIPGKGFFTIGNQALNPNIVVAGNSIQNGPDAVALCIGTPAEFPTGFLAANLGAAKVDAVAYGTADPEDTALITALGITGGQVDEGTDGTKSVARVPDGGTAFNSSTYLAQAPTPGATNGTGTPPAAGYSTWATTNAGGQGIGGDFDGDGLKNGLEYFFGATGSSFTANPAITAGKITWPTAGVTDLNYKVQTSPDLVTWTTVSAAGLNLTVPGAISYTLPASTPGAPKLFVRFVVETPPVP